MVRACGMKRVFRSIAQRSICPLAASLTLGLVACGAADDADDPPSFEAPPFVGAGQGATPGAGLGGNGPTGAAGQSGQSPSGTGGNGPVSGTSGEGNGG